MIVNPGTALFDSHVGAHLGQALVTYDDFKNAATTVASLDNNPAAITAAS